MNEVIKETTQSKRYLQEMSSFDTSNIDKQLDKELFFNLKDELSTQFTEAIQGLENKMESIEGQIQSSKLQEQSLLNDIKTFENTFKKESDKFIVSSLANNKAFNSWTKKIANEVVKIEQSIEKINLKKQALLKKLKDEVLTDKEKKKVLKEIKELNFQEKALQKLQKNLVNASKLKEDIFGKDILKRLANLDKDQIARLSKLRDEYIANKQSLAKEQQTIHLSEQGKAFLDKTRTEFIKRYVKVSDKIPGMFDKIKEALVKDINTFFRMKQLSGLTSVRLLKAGKERQRQALRDNKKSEFEDIKDNVIEEVSNIFRGHRDNINANFKNRVVTYLEELNYKYNAFTPQDFSQFKAILDSGNIGELRKLVRQKIKEKYGKFRKNVEGSLNKKYSDVLREFRKVSEQYQDRLSEAQLEQSNIKKDTDLDEQLKQEEVERYDRIIESLESYKSTIDEANGFIEASENAYNRAMREGKLGVAQLIMQDTQTTIKSLSLALDAVRQVEGGVKNAFNLELSKAVQNPKVQKALDELNLNLEGSTLTGITSSLQTITQKLRGIDKTGTLERFVNEHLNSAVEQYYAGSYAYKVALEDLTNSIPGGFKELHKYFVLKNNDNFFIRDNDKKIITSKHNVFFNSQTKQMEMIKFQDFNQNKSHLFVVDKETNQLINADGKIIPRSDYDMWFRNIESKKDFQKALKGYQNITEGNLAIINAGLLIEGRRPQLGGYKYYLPKIADHGTFMFDGTIKGRLTDKETISWRNNNPHLYVRASGSHRRNDKLVGIQYAPDMSVELASSRVKQTLQQSVMRPRIDAIVKAFDKEFEKRLASTNSDKKRTKIEAIQKQLREMMKSFSPNDATIKNDGMDKLIRGTFGILSARALGFAPYQYFKQYITIATYSSIEGAKYYGE